jgi:DNA mismatch repair protein MutL
LCVDDGRIREATLLGEREVVELPAADVELLADEAEALAALGVRVGRFGPTSIAVHSLPTLLSAKDPERLLGGILDRLRAGRGAGSREHLLESILHSMACRAAVMSGDPLTEDQARELMRQAGAIDTSQSCAHGRPTVLKIPGSHLLRHFGR